MPSTLPFAPPGFFSDLQRASELAVGAGVGIGAARRWHPGLPLPCHGEIFASSCEGTGAALALALLGNGLGDGPGTGAQVEGRPISGQISGQEGTLLWVQDREAQRRTGRPYRPGLPPAFRRRIVHVAAKTAQDALFAMEEGVKCRELAGVIGEIAGNPKAFDFTASRRLTLAAERHGVPLLVVRVDAARDLSSARMRWEARQVPSARPRWNAAAPGAPAWRAELFRARAYAPGEWILRDDGTCPTIGLAAERVESGAAPAPDHGDLVRAAGDRPLAAC